MGVVRSNIILTIPFCYARLKDTRNIMLLNYLDSNKRIYRDSNDYRNKNSTCDSNNFRGNNERMSRAINNSQNSKNIMNFLYKQDMSHNNCI